VAPASTTPRPTTRPTTTLPGATTLPTLPPDCTPPAPATVIFVGRLEAAAGGVGRFEVEAVRRDPEGHVAIGRPADVRIGDDLRFLVLDRLYLVAAGRTGAGELASKVVEPKPLFGGDQVVGLNDADPDCPPFVDPIVVRNGDGSSVDTGVFGGFIDDTRGIAMAFLVPAAAVFGVLLALVIVKYTLIGIGKGFAALGGAVRRRRLRRYPRGMHANPPLHPGAPTRN
jgi:hypothetical protein